MVKDVMRNYLLAFFEEFQYEVQDAKQLLCTYDIISLNEEANTFFQGALSVYRENILLDYNEKILVPSKKIAELTRIHYTVKNDE